MPTVQQIRDALQARRKAAVKNRGVTGGSKKSIIDLTLAPDTATWEYNKWDGPQMGRDGSLFDIIPYVITQEWTLDLKAHDGMSLRELTPSIEVGFLCSHLEIPVHKNVGENNDIAICLRLAFGQKCPMCDDRKDEFNKEQPNKSITDALKPSWRCFYNIFDYDQTDKGFQVFDDVSWYMFHQLLLEAEEIDNRGQIDWDYLEGGYSIELHIREKTLDKNKFWEASKINFQEREPWGMEEANKVVSFDQLISIPTYSQVAAMHLGMPNEPQSSASTRQRTTNRQAAADRSRYTNRPPAADRSRHDVDTTDTDDDIPPEAEGACPYGYEYGVDNGKHHECEACEEEVFDGCKRYANTLKDIPERTSRSTGRSDSRRRPPADTPADRPSRSRARSTQGADATQEREQRKSRRGR